MLKIIQVIFFVFGLISIANAQDIKLECNVSAKITYGFNNPTDHDGFANVEISDSGGNFKMISVTSDIETLNNTTVATKVMKGVTAVDFSTENKWEINNKGDVVINGGKRYKFTTQIIIDRNTGSIVVERYIESPSSTTILLASGNCKKVDLSEKKF